MTDVSWVGYVTAIGSVATPVIVLALMAVGWRFRRKFDRQLELEDKLRDDRIDIYNHILEPFILFLSPDAAWEQRKGHKRQDKNAVASQTLLSLEYRKYGFKLSLVGSDEVVSAYNDLFQHFYTNSSNTEPSMSELKIMMGLLGNFLLQIRRSMGNESTKLDKWQMLEWFIVDARKMRDA